MAIQDFQLWQNGEHDTLIHYYPAENKRGEGAVIIFAGGGYTCRASHEDDLYAKKLNEFGLDCFTVDYRVAPNRFPLPLLDARRALRFVRANAAKFGVDRDKLAVMGSSAGGHLASMVSTYRAPIEGEGIDAIDGQHPFPNAQILCYPVISLVENYRHAGSAQNLLGEREYALAASLSPERLVIPTTPPAFIWHTSSDGGVPVMNSYRYAEALTSHGVPVEMHIYPIGRHGLGLAPELPHIATWAGLLRNWLVLRGWLTE